MRVLGIDPGSTLIGYALVRDEGVFTLEDCGLLEIKEKDPSYKLLEIKNEINKIIEEYKPDIIGVEKLFFAKNKKTAIEVAQARGVIVAQALSVQKNLVELTPMQVKSTVVGYGSADKKAVSKITARILNLKEEIKEDNTADAVAIAIASAMEYKARKLEN